MIWVVVSVLVIFWGWCIYEFINAPEMPEDWTDEQYFITRKDEDE